MSRLKGGKMFDLNNLEVVKINKPKPNDFQIHLLATELFYGIQEFYSNPENMKRFEALVVQFYEVRI